MYGGSYDKKRLGDKISGNFLNRGKEKKVEGKRKEPS